MLIPALYRSSIPCTRRIFATQDDDEDAQRRRMSQRGLPEVPLQREMVDHVVDALFDKCVTASHLPK